MYTILVSTDISEKIEKWNENTVNTEYDMDEFNDNDIDNDQIVNNDNSFNFETSEEALINSPHTINDKYLFFSGNPTVEVIKGTIHLFNDTENSEVKFKKLPKRRSRILCAVAVPSWMNISDFFTFCGKHSKNFEHVRILCDSSPNRYMAVIKFINQKFADAFYMEYTGKEFSSLGTEACYLGYVKKAEFFKSSLRKSKGNSSSLSKELFPSSLKEIPTCPVCLERLDATVSGLLTIPCQHTFHCQCLIRWKEDNSCPVCRYIQVPSGKESSCVKCGTRTNLWICLLCGHVGCSRYHALHAYEHYKETMHNYSLEIETQRVWDYAGDGYVHRLIQNKTDGKLVEFPSPDSSSDARSPDSKDDILKMESIILEYQYLMTAQLETQRIWFEDKLKEQQVDYETKILKMKKEKDQVSLLKEKAFEKLKTLEKERRSLQDCEYENKKLIKELQEQVRDLMIHFEMHKTVTRKDRDGDLENDEVITIKNMENKVMRKENLNINPNASRLSRKKKK